MKISGNIITLGRAETRAYEGRDEASDKLGLEVRARAVALAQKLGRQVTVYASRRAGGYVARIVEPTDVPR